ncbi:Glycosyltransferase involved in cell wall bisynthesis [Amphibacillus marinus]|uniref:Glycosyltransferase involved in cell wall bisynthesis n=1 Tax=Amphibacillus marinus TaxID=872970 RepID=A0A1H8N701_9BACI|nr:glycosyltransferase [Amphibacillus marinus]SEO25326.1 Glycosyltransferase involved in cell wall bisynthesis [Amphibacillus marinus]
MKKKISLIIPSLRGGGSERVTLNIVRKLSRKKFDIQLIILHNTGPLADQLPNDIHVVDLKTSRVRYSIFKLIKELNKFQPDVIFSTLGHLNLMLLGIKKRLKSKPIIIVRQNNVPSKSINKNRIIFYFLYKLLYPKSDLVISQCNEMKEDMIKSFGLKEEKIKVIYNPLDVSLIKSKMLEGNPYDHNLINIVVAGRLTYQKGFDIIIKEFYQISKNIQNVHLTILGEGELYSELSKLVEYFNLRDKVDFVGFQANPYPYYYNAYCYILSSRWEGFPNTLLEALACETMVISSNCKTGPKEILEDGYYGYLVDVNTKGNIKEAFIDSLGVKVDFKKNREKDFDIKKIIKEYEDIFNSSREELSK